VLGLATDSQGGNMYREKNSQIGTRRPSLLLLFIPCIVLVFGFAGCSEDTPNEVIPHDDGSIVFDEVDFLGDQGVTVEQDGIEVAVSAHSLSGEWTLGLAQVPAPSYDDVEHVDVLTPIVRLQLTPGATGELMSENKSLILLTVRLPLPPGYSDLDNGVGVMTFLDDSGEHFITFVETVIDEAAQIVELTLVFSTQVAEWIADRIQDGIDFYYVLFPNDCPVYGTPDLVAMDNSPLGDRRPLILVHGFSPFDLCAPEAETEHMTELANDVVGSDVIKDLFKVYSYKYPVSVGLNQSGLAFATVINERFEQSTHIVVAAYSMGGLVARSAMETHGLAGRVDEFVTLGTPHSGTILAFADDAMDALGVRIIGIPGHFDSAADLEIGSPFLTTLNGLANYRGFYNCIGGDVTSDNCSAFSFELRSICWLTANIDGDLIVPLGSALLPGTQHDVFSGPQYNHFSLPGLEDVRGRVLELLEYIPDQNSVIVPLQVGNWWQYKYSDSSIRTLKIDGASVVEFEGKDYDVFHWRWYEGVNPISPTYLVQNNEAGLFILGHVYDDEITFTPSIELRYPVSVGEQWYGSSGDFYTSMTIGESITVPAGTFNCNRYNWVYADKTEDASNAWSLFVPLSHKPDGADLEKATQSVMVSPDMGVIGLESPVGTSYYKLVTFNLVVK